MIAMIKPSVPAIRVVIYIKHNIPTGITKIIRGPGKKQGVSIEKPSPPLKFRGDYKSIRPAVNSPACAGARSSGSVRPERSSRSVRPVCNAPVLRRAGRKHRHGRRTGLFRLSVVRTSAGR